MKLTPEEIKHRDAIAQCYYANLAEWRELLAEIIKPDVRALADKLKGEA